MCLTQTATVITVEGDEATVELAGRSRRLPALLVPDLRPGERVLVGLGVILARDDGSAATQDRFAALPGPHPSTARECAP